MSNIPQNIEDHLESNIPLDMPFSRQSFKRTELMKYVATLPKVVRKKIRALRKLQLQTTNLEAEFHRKVYDVEKTFEEKHKIIFEKRNQIINGEYDPTEDECDYPDAELPMEFMQGMGELSIDTSEHEDDLEHSKGIPDFWLTILKIVPLFDEFVKPHDEPALKHLTDIKAISKCHPELSFQLEFYFSPNEFFSNPVLTKEYFLKCDPDGDDPFAFDGPEIYKCVGCDINWFDGKNLTIKTVKKKNQVNDRGTMRTTKVESFFNFFDPPELPENETDVHFEGINILLETDFEIGHYLKERIIPRAVLFFTGEADDFSEDTSEENLGSEDCAISEESSSSIGQDGEGDVAPERH